MYRRALPGIAEHCQVERVKLMPQDEERQIFPEFTPNLFFYLLLPPIILEAAFALHNKVFINNIRTVLLYAVIGTVINFLLIGGGLILVQVN